MHTQMHTSHVYGCQRAFTTTPFYWLPCERICDMEAHMLRLTQSTLFRNTQRKQGKCKKKKWRVYEVKILNLWRVSLWTACISPRWDLSNPYFIINVVMMVLNFEWFGLNIRAKLGQTYFISKLLNRTDFTPPQSKTNMHLGHYCNLLELVLKLDALLPLLFKPNLETFQPVVLLHTGWSQRGSLLLQVQHRSLKKKQENWQKAPTRAWRMTFRTCSER